MDAKYLQEIKARADAATLGPWDEYENGNRQQVVYSTAPTENPSYEIARIPNKSDAAFIARARTDIPALVAEVERLTEELDSAKSSQATLETERDAAIALHKDCAAELSLMRKALELSVAETTNTLYAMEKAGVIRITSTRTTEEQVGYYIRQAQEQEENK